MRTVLLLVLPFAGILVARSSKSGTQFDKRTYGVRANDNLSLARIGISQVMTITGG